MTREQRAAGLLGGYALSGIGSWLASIPAQVYYEKDVAASCEPTVASVLQDSPLSKDFAIDTARKLIDQQSVYSYDFYRALQHSPLTKDDAFSAAKVIVEYVSKYIRVPDNLFSRVQDGIMSCTSKAPDALANYVSHQYVNDPIFWTAVALAVGTPIGLYVGHRISKSDKKTRK
jgi:hypothetical protein